MFETAQDLISIAMARVGKGEDARVVLLLSAAQVLLGLDARRREKLVAENSRG